MIGRMATWILKENPVFPLPGKKQGLKQANTSMSVPPLASYEWAIKHNRNRKTTEKHKRDQIRVVPF